MNKETLLEKFLVKLFRIPAIKNSWDRNYKALEFKNIPWTKLEKPLKECKIVLITTGGIHLESDKEFDLSDPNGDCTFRRIPYDTNFKDLIITHKYYDHHDAGRDPNLILPIEVLSELQSEGMLGPSCENHFSFMGHIEEPHLTTLIQKSSVEAAKEIRQQKADIALLVPAWGICNQTVGLVQREVERQGISTVGISIARSVSESVKPPRTYYLKYPFGHAMGEAFNRPQQKQIFLDCLKILETATEPGKIFDSRYRWKRHKFE